MNIVLQLSALLLTIISQSFVRSSPFTTRATHVIPDPATTCSRPGLAALTYDDGPYDYENKISDYLNARQIKGTFYVNGNNYECIYDEAIVKHLKRKILGVKPKFFRPPYGAFDQKSLTILKKRGYIVANWSFDSEDAVGATPEQSMASYKELSKQFPASQITLNHETYQTTAEKVTPYAVPLLQKAGYKLVHVSECLGTGTKLTDLYQWVGKPSARDASWTCNGTPAPTDN